MEFSDVLVEFSVGLSAALLGIAFWSQLKERWAARESLDAIRRADVTVALESHDLELLRTYIQEELRSVRVADYVGQDEVRRDFDRLVTQVAGFVDRPEQVESDLLIQDEEAWRILAQPELEPELAEVARDFLDGDIWTGLARLRRAFEGRIQEQFGPGEPIARGAGRLLRLAESEGFVEQDWARRLQYAIGICNRGVHGDAVAEDEAWEALNIVNAWWQQDRPVWNN